VDESATGSVNFWSNTPVGSPAMHLRAPSVDQGVQAFVWSAVFFLFMWLGGLAVGVSDGLAFVVSLVAAAAIFLFVRLRGGRSPRR
jgi:hypothetical protein